MPSPESPKPKDFIVEEITLSAENINLLKQKSQETGIPFSTLYSTAINFYLQLTKGEIIYYKNLDNKSKK